jgi:hypothetical protein
VFKPNVAYDDQADDGLVLPIVGTGNANTPVGGGRERAFNPANELALFFVNLYDRALLSSKVVQRPAGDVSSAGGIATACICAQTSVARIALHGLAIGDRTLGQQYHIRLFSPLQPTVRHAALVPSTREKV